MTDPDPLQRLIEASVADPRREPEFLRALLDAKLYLHIARPRPGSRTRVIQFDRPDGLRVTPLFTTTDRAERAAAGVVDVGTMVGRELFVATRGHVLMIDPNDTTCTLYPEEVEALLAGNAAVAPMLFDGEGMVAIAESDPNGFGATARQALEPVEPVESLTLGRTGNDAWLVIASVPSAWAERAARALSLALGSRTVPPTVTIDFTTLDPEEGVPEWYTTAGLRPFWIRPTAARTH